jgi:hypothetical protein
MKQTEHYFVVKGTVSYDENGAFTSLHFDIDHETCFAHFNGKTIYIPSEDEWVNETSAPYSVRHDDDLLTHSLAVALEDIEQKETYNA